MNAESLRISPLLLLPGVALLVLSTANRFGQLHDEFRRQQGKGESKTLGLLRKRARLFRNALVSLYSSAALLAVSSVIGSLASRLPASWHSFTPIAAAGMTIVAVVIVAFAALLLVRESSILLSVIEDEACSVNDNI